MDPRSIINSLAIEKVGVPVTKDEGPPFKQFSKQVKMKMRGAFGPRRMRFFEIYGHMRAMFTDESYDPGFSFEYEFRSQRRLIFTTLVNDHTKNEFKTRTADIMPYMRRIDARTLPRSAYRRIVPLYAELIEMVAADRDVFLVGMRRGAGWWKFYRSVSKGEEKLKRLRRDDPLAYETIQKQKAIVKVVDDKVKAHIESLGLIPKRTRRSGQLLWSSVDPTTQEATIFEVDRATGEIRGVGDEEYKEELKQRSKSEQRARRVFVEDLDELRSVPPELFDKLGGRDPEYVAITDDKAKSNGLTRIYPTIEIYGEKVVSDGRYKGIYVDDLVNKAGRQIEGVAYNYDFRTGRPQKLEVKNSDGSPNVRATREPYVTVDTKGRLYLKIPTTRPYTLQRRAMKDLSKEVPSVEMVPKTYSSVFRFEEKDFGAARDALGSFSMSKAATEKIRAHFLRMAEFDLSTARENLKHYSAESIGGFKPGRRLLTKQMESMAWLESRGNNGVCALGTGVGKTSAAIAIMLKLQKDDLHEEEDNNGRYLYVCETALVGNLPKEIYKFSENPDDVLSRVDILTYTKFAKMRREDSNFGQDYIAVFFDEAHKMRNHTSSYARAAMSLNHPRKVMFTASPMTRSPMEMYVLAAISNNEDINTTEGRRKQRLFQKRFCETVGGRIVGIKDNPVVQREFRVWVKRNLFYADKRDVEEIVLPEITPTIRTMTMDPRVERLYRSTTKEMEGTLRALVLKYRDRDTGPEAGDRLVEGFRIQFAAQLRKLNQLGNTPELFWDDLTPEEQAMGRLQSPKVDAAVDIIDESIDAGARYLLHTDDPGFAGYMAEKISRRYPFKKIACGLASRIDVYGGGRVIDTYRRKKYVDTDGTEYSEGEWKVYVLSHKLQSDPSVMAAVVTSTYAVGQNLQAFSETIMLDRDSWNAEVMQQRRGRNWRQGQDKPVRETTIDVVYNQVHGDTDATLDQIRRWVQELEEELFDSVVIESQSEALGKEVREMEWISSYFTGLNRRLMEMSFSPTPARAGDLEV